MKPIVLHRRLPHPLERVWRAVSEDAELAAWMPGGGGFPEPVVCEPPRVIAWEAAGQTFRIELEADGDATRLTFTHTLPAGDRDQFAQGWELYFARLDALLAGRPLDEQEAHDERRFTLDDGPVLRVERRFPVPVDRLWRALTDPDELQHWFPTTMEVVEAGAPRRLVARWHGSTLRFDLEPDGASTRLTFTHAFDDRDQAALSAAGWDRCLVRLEALLRGDRMGEAASLELWSFVHERYAEAFGVDPETGRRAFAAHPAT